MISVVIPTYNREKQLPRAISSVINQTIDSDIEIIIVDDASTDNTQSLIQKYQTKYNTKIRYLKNSISYGGAVSRNRGAEVALGKHIAFLDSDDEWLPNHLEISMDYLKKNQVQGVFSKFVEKIGNKNYEPHFDKKLSTTKIGDYILSGKGDTRTSTFLFTKNSFDKIKFDEKLEKYQDWDLAIRFDEKYKLGLNSKPTVIIHSDVNNRMSSTNNHNASKLFMEKHIKKLSSSSIGKFYSNLAFLTLRYEGKNNKFKYYLKNAKKLRKSNDINTNYKVFLMNLPFLNAAKIYDYLIK